MEWAMTVLTPPAAEPVTVDEAKAHLRVTHTEDDAYIAALIRAARQWCEDYQGRSYITQRRRLHLAGWPRGAAILLPRPPVRSIEAVTYRNDAGEVITVEPTLYRLDEALGAVVLAPGRCWPGEALDHGLPVAVDYTAGYGDKGEDVPEPVRQAVLLLVGHWYAHREPVAVGTVSRVLEFAVDALLWPQRVFYAGPEVPR